MKLTKIAVVVAVVAFVPLTARASCSRARGLLVFHVTALSCRSALPYIANQFEAGRENHEEQAQQLRETLPNADSLYVLRPFDELKADALEHVHGVIVDLVVDAELELPPNANLPSAQEVAWKPSPPTTRTFFLGIKSNQCDALPAIPHNLLLEDPDCCDGGGGTSCTLHLLRVSLPPPDLLKRLSG